jgi:hypothetical protein
VKRTVTVVTLALGMALIGAGTSIAQNYPPNPNGNTGGAGGTGDAGGVALTGANVTLGMVLVAALLLVGLAALVVSRRRARA